MLERVDWRTDLHFDTRTTIDTLDYSGTALNRGSKVVIAVAGKPRRGLPAELAGDFTLPAGLANPHIVMPGVLALEAAPAQAARGVEDIELLKMVSAISSDHPLNRFPLVVVVDDSDFVARSMENFVWAVFTRANPAVDIYGVDAFTSCKHWGCRGALLIDARSKPHHAPVLEDVPEVEKRVDQLGVQGGPLHGII